MNIWHILLIVSINTFVIIDGKETGKEKNNLNPGYAGHLAIPCIIDNEANNKYLKSVQPDVENFFPYEWRK